MKNLKIYKPALALVTATSILLLCGCSTSKNENQENKVKDESACTHLTVYFDDKPVTFKECEGYDIATYISMNSSEAHYTIQKDNLTIISGSTTMYNEYHVYHSITDELIDEESVQKYK